MGSALWRDLPRAAAAVAGNPSIRVLVIAAKGPHFTVGLDLKELGGNLVNGGLDTPADAPSKAVSSAIFYKSLRAMQDSVTAITELSIPAIAAVHGYCIGGGVDLICACDIRLCSGNAKFSVREAKVAIVADLGTLQRLPRTYSTPRTRWPTK